MQRTSHNHRVQRRILLSAGIGLILGLVAGATPSLAASGDIDLTIDGVPFEMARGEVMNDRTIAVDGSSVVIATWEERVDNGEFASHYGISLDGHSIVRVKQASYVLGLRYAHFDPLDAMPSIETDLSASPDGRLFLVQFVSQPLEIFNRQISALGGTVQHYVAQYAYLVEMDPAVRDAVAALPYVRWVGEYHRAYRLEEEILDAHHGSFFMAPDQVYNIQSTTVDGKQLIADQIAAIGGLVHQADAGKHLVTATLTVDQVLSVADFDQVVFIDRWSPYEEDMNIARQIGGADYIESQAGYTGVGVRAEVFDGGFQMGHVDMQNPPLIAHGAVSVNSHGTACAGIQFGDGTGQPIARGLIPDAQGYVCDYDLVGLTGPTRYTFSGQLVQPPYECIFQTSSVGSSRTSQYSTISAGHDDILFDFDIVFCQSQSNAGTQQSRPQAWAKNIVSGGGVYHYNTLDKSNDRWNSGASIGPASDGRIKPTFTHFYDQIYTTYTTSTTGYGNFGGTSGATPLICGHVGLFYQMWNDGIFGNTVDPNGTVFDNRAHMTTAKAVLVNTAEQYNWLGGGANSDITRFKQGWGMPDLETLYDLREDMMVIDEDDILLPFGTQEYSVIVEANEPYFKVSMAYADPPGNPAVQSQHRINDLDLKVVSPTGTIYAGNLNIANSLWTIPGEVYDDKNTVECVFVQSPEAGTWRIQVIATELIQDSHVETAELDADFALVATPVLRETAGIGPEEVPATNGLNLAVRAMGPGIPYASMSFDIDRGTAVRLRVFDVHGRLVNTVHDARLEAGSHTLEWRGVDEAGHKVGAGVYFARLDAGPRHASAKVLIMR